MPAWPHPMIAQDIGELLELEIDALEFGNAGDPTPINVFVDKAPRDPGELVSLYTAAGPPADSGLGYDTPHLQVVARGTADPRTAYLRIMEVYGVLHGLAGVNLPSGRYLAWCLALSSEPARLGPDENGRHRYSFTFELEVRSVTEHRE